MAKPGIKCKVDQGIKFCTVSMSSGRTFTLRAPLGAAAASPISMTIFTSPGCSWCHETESKIRRITKPISDMVNIKMVNVESDEFMTSYKDDRIDYLPTIKVGRNIIVGDFDDDQIWTSILNANGR
jgi:glutaredoxin